MQCDDAAAVDGINALMAMIPQSRPKKKKRFKMNWHGLSAYSIVCSSSVVSSVCLNVMAISHRRNSDAPALTGCQTQPKSFSDELLIGEWRCVISKWPQNKFFSIIQNKNYDQIATRH